MCVNLIYDLLVSSGTDDDTVVYDKKNDTFAYHKRSRPRSTIRISALALRNH